jgi:hypothetical protein
MLSFASDGTMRIPFTIAFLCFSMSLVNCGSNSESQVANTTGQAGSSSNGTAGSGLAGTTQSSNGTGGTAGTMAASGTGGTTNLSGAAGTGLAGHSGSSGMGGSGVSGSNGTAGNGGNNNGSGGSSGSGTTGGSAGNSMTGNGHIVYQVPGTGVQRLEAIQGAQPQPLAAQLEQTWPGVDKAINLSNDGTWIGLVTTRFGCGSWECLALIDTALTTPELVTVSGGQTIHPEGTLAIASGGQSLVYEAGDGPHQRDLYVVNKTQGSWSQPIVLTENSPHAYHRQPSLSADGKKLLFDCGPVPYSGPGTNICEIGLDGSGYRIVMSINDFPNGQPGLQVHSGSYAPDGSIVFEGEQGAEQIYRIANGSTIPTLIAAQFSNDNTPCVLPDGRIVSFWLGNSNNPNGYHEIKVMNADGSNFFMALSGVDILDSQLGCGH